MPVAERTIVDLREELAMRAMDDRYTVSEVAELFGVSRPTVRLWRDRYRAQGREGLNDRSHAPHGCPHRTAEAIEQLIVEERTRWGFGSKKILQRLEESHPDLTLPKRATIDAILVRRGLVERQRARRRRSSTPFAHRYAAREPGELTTMDFKGEFRLTNGVYCYPLTVVDRVSRYVLACTALDSMTFERSWPVIEGVFREYGLPRAVQTDNGPPFGAPNGPFSRLSVELMALGVQPVFSRPGRPQDNGSHERMHRELKAETTYPPGANLTEQQAKFDAFIHKYNVERPHEGIGMQRPARVYVRPERPYPKRRRAPEYPAHFEVRKVTHGGIIKLRQSAIFISTALIDRYIALEPTDVDQWTVHFYSFVIGKIDARTNQFG